MSQPDNVFIDFDGTLVRENSSQLLTQVLLERAGGRGQVFLTKLLTGRAWRRIVQLGFGALSRIFCERDIRLMVVLWWFRSLLAEEGDGIMKDVASRLTLNPLLLQRHEQPFAIISTGLSPVIEAFLKRYPHLSCNAVYASELTVSPRFSIRLLPLEAKFQVLSNLPSSRYFTDYDKEILLFKKQYPSHATVEIIPDAQGNDIFYLRGKK